MMTLHKDVIIDCYKMAKTSKQYEQMEDGVIEFDFFDAVDDRASGIGDTAGK